MASKKAFDVQKSVRTMSRAKAVRWIREESKGRIFGVTFIKRTNGETRVMTCRYGVRSHAKGIGLKFDPTSKKLIVIWDMRKGAYRMIPEEGIRNMLIAGRFYKVT